MAVELVELRNMLAIVDVKGIWTYKQALVAPNGQLLVLAEGQAFLHNISNCVVIHTPRQSSAEHTEHADSHDIL